MMRCPKCGNPDLEVTTDLEQIVGTWSCPKCREWGVLGQEKDGERSRMDEFLCQSCGEMVIGTPVRMLVGIGIALVCRDCWETELENPDEGINDAGSN